MTCHSAHAHQLECCKWLTQLHTMCSLPATYTGNAGTLHWQVLRKVLHVSAKFELLSSSPEPRRAGWEAQQLSALHASCGVVSQALALLAQTMSRQQRSTEQGTMRCQVWRPRRYTPRTYIPV